MIDLKIQIHEAAREDRNVGIGSTDARRIAEGKEWYQLWLEKTGREPRTDLSRAWKPQLGIATEKVHAWWHFVSTGHKVWDPFEDSPVTRAVLPAHHYTSLDRIVTKPVGEGQLDEFEVLELKHTNERNDLRTAATYYMAQLQWQMYVVDAPRLRFSIIRGNNEPEWGYVERDQSYIDKLVDQVDAFWWHVTANEAPEPDAGSVVGNELAAAAKAVRIDGLRSYDMEGDNAWADAAWAFVRDKVASEGLKESERAIRALIPEDASHATGHGVSFKRDARGAYRVTLDDEAVKLWRARLAELKQG